MPLSSESGWGYNPSTDVNVGEYDGKSLILDDGSSEFLSRTFGNANGDTWTFSCWVKRGTLGTVQTIFGRESTNAAIVFDSNDKLQVNDDGAAAYVTTAVFRDTSAWMHILFTGNGTLNKVYVNSVLQTLDGSPNIGDINTNAVHRIGHNAAYGYADLYLADVHFVDGTELAASSFGETSADTGAWVMKPYTGSHGDNGFQLDFQKSGGIERGGETEFTLTSGTVLQRTAANDSSAYFEHVLTGNFRFDWRAGSTSHGAGDGQKIGIIPATQRASWNHATGNGGSGTNWYVNFGSSSSSDGQAFEDNSAESHTAVTYSTSTVFSLRREGGSTIKLYVDGSLSHTYGTTSSADMVFFYGAGEKVVTGTITNFSFEDDGNGNSGDFYTLGLGNDISGNNNDWEIEEGAAQSNDTPINNFATFNANAFNSLALSNGNLKATASGGGQECTGTMMPKTGKWYFELLLQTLDSNVEQFGVTRTSAEIGSTYLKGVNYRSDANKYVEGSSASYGATWTTGDIMGAAIDLDANTIIFYKNNSSQGSLSFTDGHDMIPMIRMGASSNIVVANFGQDSSFSGAKTAQNNADGNGEGDFTYSPPSGYLALCSKNLPEIEIGQEEDDLASDYFNSSTIYTGNGSQTRTISGIGFQPDLVWQKIRAGTTQGTGVWDVLRGFAGANALDLAETSVEGTWNGANSAEYGFVTSVGDGTVALDDGTTATTGGYVNYDTRTYALWCWKGGTAQGSTSTSGSGTAKTYTANYNVDAGFQMSAYTGNGTSGHTLPIHLDSAPEMVILKRRTGSADWWGTFHIGTDSSAPEDYYMPLNATDSKQDLLGFMNDTAPTSSVVTLGDNSGVNANDVTYLMYAWHSVEGYSSFGNYDARGGTQQFVYTGFPVGFLMVKRTDSADNWTVHDVGRDPTGNPSDSYLLLDDTAVEATYSTALVDFYSNGFCWKGAVNYGNNASGHYIYMAFSRGTGFKYSTAI